MRRSTEQIPKLRSRHATLPPSPAPRPHALPTAPARPLHRDRPPRLSRVRRPAHPRLGLRELPALRLGPLRVTPRQLDLLPSAGASERRWALLDERQRGTRFLELPVRSVLNTAASTGMGFWSINPYVGCEFGCTYCYARDTHRYAVERSGARAGAAARVGGVRAAHPGQDRRGRGACPHARSRTPGRTHAGHRHGHRSISTGRAPVPAHPPDSRGAAGAPRARHRHHHQVAAGDARPRPARPARPSGTRSR